MENIKRIDPDQLKDISGGTYDEAMKYVCEIAKLHGWDLKLAHGEYLWIINHMDDEEYATFVNLYYN